MEDTTPSGGHAGYLERRRARRKQKQEADLLCAQIYDLTDQLLDVRFERGKRSSEDGRLGNSKAPLEAVGAPRDAPLCQAYSKRALGFPAAPNLEEGEQ